MSYPLGRPAIALRWRCPRLMLNLATGGVAVAPLGCWELSISGGFTDMVWDAHINLCSEILDVTSADLKVRPYAENGRRICL